MISPKERLGRFPLTKLNFDLSGLSANERKAIPKFLDIAKIFDRLYMLQYWKGNLALLEKLESAEPRDENLIEFYYLMKGPWDIKEDDVAFVEGAPEKPPPGGSFYPEDMEKKEFEDWVKTLPPDEHKKAKGFYHVVRRREDGGLYLKPYSEEYAEYLKPASKLMKEAADLVDDESLKKFLRLRAEAFLTNEYTESELAWLSISNKSRLEVTVGPYEVYTDNLFGAKAAFEIFVHVRDFQSSELLKKFENALQEVEDSLPIPDEYKNKHLKPAPIVVTNELFTAGDYKAPMTSAYNLPNDEEVMVKGGSKLVLIKNVQEGKYLKIVKPIADAIIAKDQLEHLSFNSFFTHILLHEVAHSNGPHFTAGPERHTVRSRLQEHHSGLEEAKADVTSVFGIIQLLKSGLLTEPTPKQLYVTLIPSIIRTIRFGITEAHALANCIQLMYILEHGGLAHDRATGRLRVDFDKIGESIRALTKEIMLIQGNGDKERASVFIKKYTVISEDMRRSLIC